MSKQCQAFDTAVAAAQIYQIRLSVISMWNIHGHPQSLSKYQMLMASSQICSAVFVKGFVKGSRDYPSHIENFSSLACDSMGAEYRCKLAGAQRNSFPSVVAGGADACVIHYLRNDKVT